MKFLKQVNLFDTLVTDLSPLYNCPMLSELNAGKLPFRSLSVFYELDSLINLSLHGTTLDSLEGIERLTQLTFFEVSGVIDNNLAPLLSLPQLKEVMLDKSMSFAAEKVSELATFEILYR